MRINNNIASLQSYTSILRTDKKVDQAMRRISSGVRINSVSDDAAGMAISHKLRTQIRGLEMANRNSMDGISLLQTAEGALQEVDDMLKRIRELAIQASNASMEPDDRRKANEEVHQLLMEIDETSFKTEFNTIKLLNGGAARLTKSNQMPGTVKTMYVSNEMDVGALQYEILSVGVPASTQSTATGFAAAAMAGGKLNINGESVTIPEGSTAQEALAQMQELFDRTGLTATVLNGGSWDDYITSGEALMLNTSRAGSSQTLEIKGSFAAAIGLSCNTTGTDAVLSTAAGMNTFNGMAMATVIDGNDIKFTGPKNQVIEVKIELDKPSLDGTAWLLKNGADIATAPPLSVTTNVLDFGILKLQVGPNKSQEMAVQIPNMAIEYLGVEFLHIKTFNDAQEAIGLCDKAMARVAEVRATLGAYQNRLEHTISSLSVTSEATTQSLSRIYDADIGWEMTQLTQNRVLSQAAMAILAQANQRPQQVLQLM